MRKISAAQVKRIVRKWQPILGLNDYLITIEVVETDSNKLASVNASDESHRAKIIINSNHDAIQSQAGSLGDTTLEETVVHEMLHIVLINLKDYAVDNAMDDIGGDQGKQIAETIRRIEERTVDKLALALVRKFNE